MFNPRAHSLAIPRQAIPLIAFVFLLAVAGCQQQMAEQPSYKPLDECDFFADGRSARPLVPGTVPRGYLKADTAFWTGRRPVASGDQDPDTGLTPEEMKAALQPNTPKGPGDKLTPIDEKKLYAPFVDEFPIPITEKVIEHGYNRFMIYCVVCHDPLGTGYGRIVERGYTQPPSYHIERLRRAPVGHFFAVISEGYGSMPSYASQIPVRDRWAIVAYVKALQASQHWPEAAEKSRVGPDRAASAGPPLQLPGGPALASSLVAPYDRKSRSPTDSEVHPTPASGAKSP